MRFIFIILFVFLSACREELVHVASEREANTVMLRLRSEGVDARKIFLAKEWIIDVPKASLTESLKILEAKRVFRDEYDDKDSGGSDLFSSRQEKEARAGKLIASNIATTLRVLPDVLDARVHIYQGYNEISGFDNKKDRTASILLLTREDKILNEEQIKELVSQGAGVDKSKVSLVIVSQGNEVSDKDYTQINIENEVSSEIEELIGNENYSFESKNFSISLQKNIFRWFVVFLSIVFIGALSIFFYLRKRKNNSFEFEELHSIIES